MTGTNDECFTSDDTWDDVAQWLPRDTLLYDPFNGDAFAAWANANGFVGLSGHDFWNTPFPKGCVVVTNPPFTARAEVLTTLRALRCPFLILLPLTTLKMNIMNALTDCCMIFWGADQRWKFEDGKERRARMFALCRGLKMPRINWIMAPIKKHQTYKCKCGTMVQTHHKRHHEQQAYHKQKAAKSRLHGRRASW